MSRWPHALCSLLFSLSLFSCATDVANRFYLELPARPVEEVDILWERPTRPYELIADFQSRNESPEDMRQKAADAGADAVIVATLGARDYSQNDTKPRDVNDRSSNYTRIVGTAIRYRR